jgi:hypothetical protein
LHSLLLRTTIGLSLLVESCIPGETASQHDREGSTVAKSPASASNSGPLLDGLRRALGGPQPLAGKDGLFPSGAKGKELARAAVEEGYLTSRTEMVPPPAGKKGKAKEIVLGELTPKGRQHVLEIDSPKKVLEALLPAVQALSSRPAAAPASAEGLRPELDKATRACVEAIQKGFADLNKKIEAAVGRMEQAVVKALPPARTGPAPDPGPVLAALREALARLPAAPPAAVPTPAPVPRPPTPPPGPPRAEPVTAEQVRTALRQAYDELCLYVEFRDKLVEMPRLYHEAVRRLPGLSVERFHRELEALSNERKLELHKLNEVHLAKERNLAIEKDERLYYYVYWK